MAKEEFVLHAETRDSFGKGPAHRLRVQGMVPAVVYSHGSEARSLSIPHNDLTPVINHSGLVSIKVKKERKPITAVIKEMQNDILRGHLKHVDFQEVKADEVISVSIPLHPHGVPAAEAQGGLLNQYLHEVEINCPANQLPEMIEVDVSGLDLEGVINAGDITLPEKVELETDPETVVFTTYVPLTEEELEEEEAAEAGVEVETGAEPEVISKGKQEEEPEAEEE